MTQKKIAIIKSEKDILAENIIESLQSAVEQAKEIPQAAYCVLMLDRSGDIHFRYLCDSRIELIGALEYAKNRVSGLVEGEE